MSKELIEKIDNTLEKQLELLAECAKQYRDQPEELAILTEAMLAIAEYLNPCY